jgi:hypothetical protein
MPTTTYARPWIPARPVPPPPDEQVFRFGDLFHVIGIAQVQARPVRSAAHARGLARRIAAAPRDVLPVLIGLGVVGVVDLRPLNHADWHHARGVIVSPAAPAPAPTPDQRPGRRGTSPDRPQSDIYPKADADPRAVDPAAVVARNDAIAHLTAMLSPHVATAVTDALAGGELPPDAAAHLAQRFTRAELADLLGLDGREVAHG